MLQEKTALIGFVDFKVAETQHKALLVCVGSCQCPFTQQQTHGNNFDQQKCSKQEDNKDTPRVPKIDYFN